MTVREILIDYLKANGYDGLCTDDCGCGIEGLGPCCDDYQLRCKPAYKWECDGCKDGYDCWTGFGDGEGCYRDTKQGGRLW